MVDVGGDEFIPSSSSSSFHPRPEGAEDLVVLPDKSHVEDETLSSSNGMKMQENLLKNSWLREAGEDVGLTDIILLRHRQCVCY